MRRNAIGCDIGNNRVGVTLICKSKNQQPTIKNVIFARRTKKVQFLLFVRNTNI